MNAELDQEMALSQQTAEDLSDSVPDLFVKDIQADACPNTNETPDVATAEVSSLESITTHRAEPPSDSERSEQLLDTAELFDPLSDTADDAVTSLCHDELQLPDDCHKRDDAVQLKSRFGCVCCDHVTDSTERMREHWQLTHEQQKRFHCIYCAKSFRNSYLALFHTQTFHEGEQLKYGVRVSDNYTHDVVVDLKTRVPVVSSMTPRERKAYEKRYVAMFGLDTSDDVTDWATFSQFLNHQLTEVIKMTNMREASQRAEEPLWWLRKQAHASSRLRVTQIRPDGVGKRRVWLEQEITLPPAEKYPEIARQKLQQLKKRCVSVFQ